MVTNALASNIDEYILHIEDGTSLSEYNPNGYPPDSEEWSNRYQVYDRVIVNVDNKRGYDMYSYDLYAPNTAFEITVNGTEEENMDAIHLRNWDTYFEAKDLVLTVYTPKSDGINLGYEGDGLHLTAQNVTINSYSSDGCSFGIRANGSAQAQKDATILIMGNTKINMNNGGTAVFAGIANTDIFGSFKKRGDAYVSLNGQTDIILGKDKLSNNSFFPNAGLYVRYNGKINANDVYITALNANKDEDVYGIYAGSYSEDKGETRIDVTGNLGISMQQGTEKANVYALYSQGGAININSARKSVNTQILGDIYTDKSDASINVNFVGPESYLQGKANEYVASYSGKSNGLINLNFSDGASWSVTGDSYINTLSLNNATLTFDKNSNTKSFPVFYKLQTQTLTLSDSIIHLNVDLSGEETLADAIHTKLVHGNGIADIKLVGSVTDHKAMSEGVGFLYQDEGTLTLQLPDRNNDGTPDQVIYQNGGIMGWKLAYQATEQENTEAEQTQIDLPEMTDGTVTGTGKGYWYLTTGDYAELPDEPDPTPDPDPNPEPTPDPDPLPPEAQQIQNLGSSVAQAVGWLSEKNDLRRRLGEVRYGTQTGAWAKVFNRQDRAQGFRYNGFKQESTGVHIGYDTFVTQTAEASWLVGATLRYAHSKQEGLETAYGGDGKLNEYSAKVYATWLHQSGAYIDVLAQTGYYDQEINGLNNSAEAVFDANYHNWGMGVSAEIGHKLPLGPQGQSNTWTSNWFIEPQLELSYFYVKGDDFTTSTGLEVNQGNADFLTGRLGFVLGKKVNYGPSDAPDKRWYQIGLIGGMNHDFLGDQTIRFTGVDGAVADVKGHGLGGTSFYYGITADWQVSDKLRIYGELDREEGDHYTKDYGINVGVKYAF